MNRIIAVKELSDDDLAIRILNALGNRDLTHDEVIGFGGNPHQAALVLDSLQATGLVEAFCGPIQPSTCKYRLAGKK